MTTQSRDEYDDVIAPCVDGVGEDCGEDGNGSGLDESSREIDEDRAGHDLRHFENPDDDEDAMSLSTTTTQSGFGGHRLAVTTPVPVYPEIEETRYTYREDDEQDIDDRHDVEPEVDIAADELAEQLDRHRTSSSASTGSGGVLSSSHQFGTNLGLIAGIVVGIVVLMTILVYAVCRYRGCSPRQRENTKDFAASGTRSAGGTSLPGDVKSADASRRPNIANASATTPLLRGDSATSGSGNLPASVPLNAQNGSDVLSASHNGTRQSKKEVKEWFV